MAGDGTRGRALTAERRERFLAMLATTAHVGRAAAAAETTAGALYQMRRRDAGFATRWEQALAEGYDRLETGLLARALATGGATEGATEGEVPFDVKLALDMLARRDARGRTAGSAAAGNAEGGRHVPVAEVEARLMRQLDALAKRLGRAA